jgi:branched-chain amino acid transport system ATP-binding protein
MLTVKNLQVRYGQAIAVAGVDLAVPTASWVALVGANGAGKSSLLRAIMGLASHEGELDFDGQNLGALPTWERQKCGIGFVPEGRQLFGQMSVEENLRVGGYTCSPAELQHGLDRAYDLFPRLAERRSQMSSTLSGGEQQMLALARALATDPAVLMVDELSMGLAPVILAKLYEHVAEIASSGVAVLAVEQNASAILRIADHAAVLVRGRIERYGPADDILRDELSALYLGSSR